MPGSACTFYKDGCENVIRGTSFAPPVNFFVGLSTTDPGVTGSTLTEPSGNNYSRVSVAASTLQWNAPTAAASNGRSIQNTNAIQFAVPSGSWGTISHWFISDNSTGGNIWFRGTVDVGGTPTPQVFSSGADVKFLAGALVITLNE